MDKEFDVFLSHNSQDKPWVIDLKNALITYHIKVWLDQDEIRPGDLFVTALEKGITECRAVALIISPKAMMSNWVKEEYHRALSLATNGLLQLIPVLYKDAELPGFLSNRNWVDFRKDERYDENVRKLVWGITGKKPINNPGDRASVIYPPPSDRLDIYIESSQQVLKSLEKLLSSMGPLYEDQCKMIIKDIDQLDGRIKLPPSYDASTTIIGLETQMEKLRNLLINFSRTCPPGSKELQTKLIDQIDIINTILHGFTKKTLYL